MIRLLATAGVVVCAIFGDPYAHANTTTQSTPTVVAVAAEASEARAALESVPSRDWALEPTAKIVARIEPLTSRAGLEALAHSGDVRAQQLLG